MYKEQGEFKKCAETSLKAVEVGRENRADYKLIAKAFARAALAYKEMEVWNDSGVDCGSVDVGTSISYRDGCFGMGKMNGRWHSHR